MHPPLRLPGVAINTSCQTWGSGRVLTKLKGEGSCLFGVPFGGPRRLVLEPKLVVGVDKRQTVEQLHAGENMICRRVRAGVFHGCVVLFFRPVYAWVRESEVTLEMESTCGGAPGLRRRRVTLRDGGETSQNV